ncbi:MAG: hypothetical protein LDL13_03280 [Calditerrivibrio sp.]|nr:hypothetical protein [Calditerrivibrio sp.]MCA1932583.1 hypothetical protein [Calditerrivibrio sp.]MCA1980015.1 hypothetical protein [Calditerrivibrio sp.]
MRKLLLVFLLLFIPNVIFSAVSTGTGYSVISESGVKVAEKIALSNAILNAITNYYEEVSPDMAENVNKDFLKLVKKFRILERGVKQYSVYYTVEVTFDESASPNVERKSNPNTFVYFINLDKFLSDFKQKLYDVTKNYLEEIGMSTRYQEDFIVNIDSTGSSDKALATFNLLKARYLIYINVRVEKGKNGNKLLTESYFYSKKDSFPTIKAEGTLAKINELSVIETYKTDLQTTMKYITTNFMNVSSNPLAEKPENKIDLIFIEFKSFNNVMNVMDTLRSKGFFTTVKVKSFVTGKAEFELNTKSDAETIKKVIDEILKGVNHDTTLEENSIYIEYK